MVPPSRVFLSLLSSHKTKARTWAGEVRLGVGRLRLLGQTVTRVTRREKAPAAGQDSPVVLEVCHKFRSVEVHRQHTDI